MKRLTYIFFILLLLACNGENVPNCFQNAGDIITKNVEVESFSKITVFQRTQLILKRGDEQSVTVETGEFLMNDIDVYVQNDRLHLENNNACNITRDYGITRIFVTSPNITEIRNSSGLTVLSQGTLTFPSLTLISEDFEDEDAFHTDGDFDLDVLCEDMSIVVNNLSSVYLRGFVDTITINYFAGDARFEGAGLLVNDADIFQRSSNDMIINPQKSIKGEIRGTGDVILLNEPPVVDIEQFYTGKLIVN